MDKIQLLLTVAFSFAMSLPVFAAKDKEEIGGAHFATMRAPVVEVDHEGKSVEYVNGAPVVKVADEKSLENVLQGTSPQALKISGFSISKDVAQNICTFLSKPKDLRVLIFQGVKIYDGDLASIVQALQEQENLRFIGFRFGSIGFLGSNAIANLFRGKALRTLDLWGTRFDGQTQQIILGALGKTQALEELRIDPFAPKMFQDKNFLDSLKESRLKILFSPFMYLPTSESLCAVSEDILQCLVRMYPRKITVDNDFLRDFVSASVEKLEKAYAESVHLAQSMEMNKSDRERLFSALLSFPAERLEQVIKALWVVSGTDYLEFSSLARNCPNLDKLIRALGTVPTESLTKIHNELKRLRSMYCWDKPLIEYLTRIPTIRALGTVPPERLEGVLHEIPNFFRSRVPNEEEIIEALGTVPPERLGGIVSLFPKYIEHREAPAITRALVDVPLERQEEFIDLTLLLIEDPRPIPGLHSPLHEKLLELLAKGFQGCVGNGIGKAPQLCAYTANLELKFAIIEALSWCSETQADQLVYLAHQFLPEQVEDQYTKNNTLKGLLEFLNIPEARSEKVSVIINDIFSEFLDDADLYQHTLGDYFRAFKASDTEAQFDNTLQLANHLLGQRPYSMIKAIELMATLPEETQQSILQVFPEALKITGISAPTLIEILRHIPKFKTQEVIRIIPQLYEVLGEQETKEIKELNSNYSRSTLQILVKALDSLADTPRQRRTVAFSQAPRLFSLLGLKPLLALQRELSIITAVASIPENNIVKVVNGTLNLASVNKGNIDIVKTLGILKDLVDLKKSEI